MPNELMCKYFKYPEITGGKLDCWVDVVQAILQCLTNPDIVTCLVCGKNYFH